MMTSGERQYLRNLELIDLIGDEREDRTGVGTKSIFGAQMHYDLTKSFPLFTTKKVWFKGVVHELLWFLKGDTNIKYLNDNGVHIWDEWADENGELGPVYGAQWRNWEHRDKNFSYEDIDQIAEVIKSIKEAPMSRRHIVSAWNVSQLDKMRLPPCHIMMQFYVAKGKLSCQMYQRSADMFLGVPFNVASYALLTCMIAQVTGLEPGQFIHTLGDAHIYNNHQEQVKEQLSRHTKPGPTLELNPEITNINDFKYEDVKVIGYDPHPSIKAPIAI